MMNGQLNSNDEAVVRLQLRGGAGRIFALDAVIDTGFTEQIALPKSLLNSLGYEPDGNALMFMADGSTVDCESCFIEIEWDGVWKRVAAWALGTGVLIGCEMLRGYALRIEFDDAGAVEISKL